MPTKTRRGLNLLLVALTLAVWASAAERRWWDGTRESDNPPPGRLLSDNDGYWGDCVLTGVEYQCESKPTNPPDIWREDKARFGRRLLDGRPEGNWWVPVGQDSGQALVVVFDFKRRCSFGEVDLCTRSLAVAVKIETRDSADGPWQLAVDRPLADGPSVAFHRLALSGRPSGRYLRLSVQAASITWLDEVLVWGDAEVSEAVPEIFQPVTPTAVVTGTAFTSIPGIAKTAFADAEYWEWQRRLGETAQRAAVWSAVATWDAITDKPILPPPAAVLAQAELILARNETEAAALALTSTSMEKAVTLVVALGPFRRLGGNGEPEPRVSGLLRVAGAIGSRQYGVNLGPLLAADNLPGRSLLRRYLTNADGIGAFPQITLTPAGSAVLWVSVTTTGAEPGVYEAELSAAPAPPLSVRVTVVDVTLPEPFIWLQMWSGTTTMFPFVYGDREAREVRFKQALGATVWNGFPEAGTAAALARQNGPAIFHIWGVGDYGHKVYNGQIDPAALTDQDAEAIAALIHGHVAKAQALGLAYDQWYIEITDEPGRRNAAGFAALAALVRRADPQVRICCNPSFWEGNGVADDAAVFAALGAWYTDRIDVSVPFEWLLRDRPQCAPLFAAPRQVRAFYTVCSQSAKSERAAQIHTYRRFAWDAFGRGWNGWGFYSYYAPRGNPWNDLDQDWYSGEDLPDYLVVYPGPHGPISTRQAEAVREGCEDFRLLTWLQERDPEGVRTALADYAAGADPAELRRRLLTAPGRK
jgi:hypothetical protein